ncbi:MAG: DNA adenine methylase [Bacteroidales bacterium]|nr:DNA adenine methylase [Bacteroidales bacterium]
MNIYNRRYIGCKQKLNDFIYDSIIEVYPKNDGVFADIFAGTGAVGYFFARHGYKTILNDTLYSNVVAYRAWMGEGDIDVEKIAIVMAELNALSAEALEDNYFSDVYGGKYFSVNDAKKAGYIRDYIEKNPDSFNEREQAYMISSLIYAVDKIANTVGHFESYLLKKPEDRGVTLGRLDIDDKIVPADIYNIDANELVRKIKCDIAYIDPPYNARQYVNFYHVLENLARWNKPTEFEGNSMKFKRNELKSDYCRSKAPKLMEDLVSNLDCSLIAVSYNNTYKAGSMSSVNTVTPDQLTDILSQKGRVTVKESDYKAFNAGKTELTGHKELLYICEVGQ